MDLVTGLSSLDTRADAWRFISGFAASWNLPLSTGNVDLDDVETRLGVTLPAAVREAYEFGLFSPEQLEYDADAKILVFRAADQAVALYGVSLADSADPDPPVFMRESLEDKAAECWTPFMQRFSLACVDLVLWDTVEDGPLSDGRDEEDDESFPELTPVPFPHYPGDYAAQWYVSEDIILRHYPSWIAIAARTPSALDAFREAHGGDWVNE